MAGIYIHIPFCKQACFYCNFHFSCSLKYKEQMLEAIAREMEMQKDYLKGVQLDSIYFGGGTPSILEVDEIEKLLEQVYSLHKVSANAEITLEANPDDLTLEKLQALYHTSINRLSIGVQSFFDRDLQFMNRAHRADEARACIENALSTGFDNLTIDLIFGTPGMSDEQWEKNLQIVFDYGIPHVSCYGLTVEPKTALDHFIKTGKTTPLDEAQSARQFELLMEKMAKKGYDHYEISNFALPGFLARHNTAYWFGSPYLGVGPSAHSYDKNSRQWNIANNLKYIRSIENGDAFFEREQLSPTQRYNEYVMTALRTMWGADLKQIHALGRDFEIYFLKNVRPFIEKGQVLEEKNSFLLSRSGKLFVDHIAMELFFEA